MFISNVTFVPQVHEFEGHTLERVAWSGRSFFQWWCHTCKTWADCCEI